GAQKITEGDCARITSDGLQQQAGHAVLGINRAVLGIYRRGTRILRSAQFLRSATVKPSRKGFALMIFSRFARPVASALAIIRAASASSVADRIATAPAPPAK